MMKTNPAGRVSVRALGRAALFMILALAVPQLAGAASNNTASEGAITPHGASTVAAPHAPSVTAPRPPTVSAPGAVSRLAIARKGAIPEVKLQQTSLGPAFDGADVLELTRRLRASGLLDAPPKGSIVRELLDERRQHAMLLAAGVPQTAFVLPIGQGVLYDRDRQRLTVDADVSAGGEDRIVLSKHVQGKSGYKLTVAGEAESRGFIQTIDITDIDIPRHRGKRTLTLSMIMDPGIFHRVENSLAIALIGSPVRPFVRETDTQVDPSDEDPTLKRIHRTTVYFRLEGAWLFDRRTGEVLSKRVRLTD
jgi:hypothetical protein